MQTERARAHDAPRVEKLFVLLLVSMRLSFAAHMRSPREPMEADRSQVARRDAPSLSRQVRKPIEAARAGPINADRNTTHGPIEPNRAGRARQVAWPGAKARRSSLREPIGQPARANRAACSRQSSHPECASARPECAPARPECAPARPECAQHTRCILASKHCQTASALQGITCPENPTEI